MVVQCTTSMLHNDDDDHGNQVLFTKRTSMRPIKTAAAAATTKSIQWIRFIRFLSSSSSCIIVLAIHSTERQSCCWWWWWYGRLATNIPPHFPNNHRAVVFIAIECRDSTLSHTHTHTRSKYISALSLIGLNCFKCTTDLSRIFRSLRNGKLSYASFFFPKDIERLAHAADFVYSCYSFPPHSTFFCLV